MRTHFLVLVVSLNCAALAGCVRTDAEMLDSSTAVISARGTAFDTPAKVVKTTLAQAARLGQQRGFAYFAIVSAQDATRTATMYQAGNTYTSGNLQGDINMHGNSGDLSAHYSGSTQTSPAWTETFVKPGEDVTIRFFRDGEVDPHAAGIWSVAAILANTHEHAYAPNAAPSARAETDNQESRAPTASAHPASGAVPAQGYNDWNKQSGN